MRDLWFGYGQGPPILREVSLRTEPGQITMLLGASGCGKTTLLRLVKGLIRPRRGSISVLGAALEQRAGGGRLDPGVAYIPQQLGLVRGLSALENTLIGSLGQVGLLPSLLRVFPRVQVERAQATLELLGLGHKADQQVYRLSGGERQRVAIARALMQEARLILADELVSHLDPVTTSEIMQIMRGIAQRGVSLLMSTHELGVVERFADRVVLLRGGAKVLDAPAGAAPPEQLSALMRVSA